MEKGLKKFEEIQTYPLLAHVGEPLPKSVVAAKNWKEARKHSNSEKWERCQLMARNALQRFTEARCWERSNEWNSLVEKLRPLVGDLLETVRASAGMPTDVFDDIKDTASWDIMFISLEHEYADIVEPLFSIPYLDPWYSKGHFPCGWTGEAFPDGWDGVIRGGKLIVY